MDDLADGRDDAGVVNPSTTQEQPLKASAAPKIICDGIIIIGLSIKINSFNQSPLLVMEG